MIGHHFQFQHFTSQFFCDLMDDLIQVFIHTTNQYLAAILRTKDDMIFAGHKA